VEIAHRKNLGSLGEIRADFGPDLHPAVEGGAKKREWGFRHALMFQTNVGHNELGVATKPFFEAVG
jgi:hypothetical protein